MTEPAPPSKVARNEQRKLKATTFNAIGLAFGAFGVVQPVVIGALTVLKVVICAVITYVLHSHALRLVAGLEE